MGCSLSLSIYIEVFYRSWWACLTTFQKALSEGKIQKFSFRYLVGGLMMVDFFCYLYLRLDGSRSWVASLRGYSFLRYLVRTVANFILPVYFRLTGGQSLYHLKSTQACKDCSGVIISLTTYPGRINTVWLAIETLLRQSVKPDAIILWLSTDQFKSLSDIPHSLLVLLFNF